MVLVSDNVRPVAARSATRRGRLHRLNWFSRLDRPGPESCWFWVIGALLLAAVRLPGFELWGDVRYTLGVERTTARTGWSAAEIWAHRPMLNRQLMAVLDHLTAGPFCEQQLLLWSAVGAGLAVWGLFRSARHRLGRSEALGLSGGVLVALLWTSSMYLMQPEWYAVLTAIGAVALAGADRSGRLGHGRVGPAATTLGAGLLLAATVLMKWTTVGTAGAAWAMIIALLWGRRRRAVAVTVSAAVLTPLILALQVWAVPHEGLWLREVAALNTDPGTVAWCTAAAPTGPGCALQQMLINEPIVSPSLVVLPAAVLLLAWSGSGRGRWAVIVLPVVGLALTVITAIVQAQWYSYHLMAAAVIAGGWLGWGLARARRTTPGAAWTLAVPALTAGVLSAMILSTPADRRAGTAVLWLGGTAAQLTYAAAIMIMVVGCVGVVWATATPTSRSARGRAGAVVSTVAVLAAFVNPVLPTTGYSYDFSFAGLTNQAGQAKRDSYTAIADQIHAAFGPDAPVVYLSFGELPYWIGNPTYCRYAAATFLQRSQWVPTGQLRGFAENLDCLADPRARYVIIQPNWLRLGKVDPSVRAAVDRYFDCGEPVLDTALGEVCARR